MVAHKGVASRDGVGLRPNLLEQEIKTNRAAWAKVLHGLGKVLHAKVCSRLNLKFMRSRLFASIIGAQSGGSVGNPQKPTKCFQIRAQTHFDFYSGR